MKVYEIPNFNLFTFLYGDSNKFQEIISLLNIGSTELNYLDAFYSKRYSRLKNVCEYYANLNDNERIELLSYELDMMFTDNWLKVTKAFMTDYNPIENYSMEEIRTPNLISTSEGNNTITDNNTIDNTTNSSQTNNSTINGNNETTNQEYPFNSNEAKPTDKQLITKNSDSTSNNTITSNEKQTQKNNSTQTQNQTFTQSGSETLKRSGNIGVTTSQQMLESEIKLRKHNIIKMIYDDIDNVLCTNYYN